MKHIIWAFLLVIITIQFVSAQGKLRVLRTNRSLINIKEGDFVYKDNWTLSPKLKPDIFVTNPFSGTKRIVFYSDIDTLSFTVQPDKKYDFIIVLNGKDTAYTQISTHAKEKPTFTPKLSYKRIIQKNSLAADTIPFTMGQDHRIHLKGKVNHSEDLDLIFDTGAGICVVTSSLIGKKVNIQIDGSQQNGSTDGVSIVNTSSSNIVEIGNLVWNKVPLLSIDYKGFPFDIVLGWVVFEDKIVEIDYEKNILVIHQSLPRLSTDYSKLEMKFINGIPYIKCKLVVNGRESETWFDFDTGSDGTLIIGQKFAKENGLDTGMKSIGKAQSMGSTGIAFKQDLVLLPTLVLGKFEMHQISMVINENDPPGISNHENIGNKILKKFNTVLDFQNGHIYLKPNNLFNTPM
jgi:hypothetical protein